MKNLLHEIQVHSMEGRVTRFEMTDAVAGWRIMHELNPNRIFAQERLVIQGAGKTVVFPCPVIVRLDFIMDGYPEWEFPRNLVDVVQSSGFDDAVESAAPATAPKTPRMDPTTCVMNEYALTNGNKIYAWLTVAPSDRTKIDSALLLHQILASPVHYIRRTGGGAIVINSAHITSITMLPGPPNISNGWPGKII